MLNNRAETQADAIRQHRPLCCMRRGTCVQVAVPRRMTNGFWHVDVKCGRCVSALTETARYKEYTIGDRVCFAMGLGIPVTWGRLDAIHGERGTARRWIIVSRHDWAEPRKYSYRNNGRWHRVGTSKDGTDIAWIGHSWGKSAV